MYTRLLHFVAISSHPFMFTLEMFQIVGHFIYVEKKGGGGGERNVGDECRVTCSHIGIN
jgi:hypothetical protein